MPLTLTRFKASALKELGVVFEVGDRYQDNEFDTTQVVAFVYAYANHVDVWTHDQTPDQALN